MFIKKSFREMQELLWLAKQFEFEHFLPVELKTDQIDVIIESREAQTQQKPLDSKSRFPDGKATSEKEQKRSPDVSVRIQDDLSKERGGGAVPSREHKVNQRQQIPQPYSPLEIARTFRHMVVHSLSNVERHIDIERTVELSAQINGIFPVFEEEIFSDTTLILLQEETDSLSPFSQIRDEFKSIAEMYADFYNVIAVRPHSKEFQGIRNKIPNPRKCFVLVISDGLSPLMASGQLIDTIQLLPPACKIVWVHPWRPQFWPSKVHSLRSGQPKRLQKSPDSNELIVQLVGLQNTSFQSILAFVHDKPMSWTTGKRIRRRGTRERNSRKQENVDVESAQLYNQIKAKVSPETVQLLSIIAWLPSGRIDISLLVQIGLAVIDGHEFDQTDIALMIASGALKHSEGSTKQKLVVEFVNPELRDCFQRPLLTSQIEIVFNTLIELGTSGKNTALEDCGINISLLLALKNNHNVPDAVNSFGSTGGLETYLNISNFLEWEGTDSLRQFINDNGIPSGNGGSGNDENHGKTSTSGTFFEVCNRYGMSGLLFRRLCTLFPRGLPISVLEHFIQSHDDATFQTQLEPLVRDLLKLGHICKKEKYVIDEDDLFFTLPSEITSGTRTYDWDIVPDFLTGSHVQEEVWCVTDQENVKLFDFREVDLDCQSENFYFFYQDIRFVENSEGYKQVKEIIGKWLLTHTSNIPHFTVLASRFAFQHYNENNTIIDQTNGYTLELNTLEEICLTEIWLSNEEIAERTVLRPRKGVLLFEYLNGVGPSNLTLPTIRKTHQYTLGELYLKVCWMLGLSIFVFDEIEVANVSRLKSVLNQSDMNWFNKETSVVADMINFRYLYNISDWYLVPDDILDEFWLSELDTSDLGIWDDDMGDPHYFSYQDSIAHLSLFIGSLLVFQRNYISNDHPMINYQKLVDMIKHFWGTSYGEFHALIVLDQLIRQVKSDTVKLDVDGGSTMLLESFISSSTFVRLQNWTYFLNAVRSIFQDSNERVITYFQALAFDSNTNEHEVKRTISGELEENLSSFAFNRMFVELQYRRLDRYSTPKWFQNIHKNQSNFSSKEWLDQYQSQDFTLVTVSESSKCINCSEPTFSAIENVLCNICAAKVMHTTYEIMGQPWACFDTLYLPKESQVEFTDKKRRLCLMAVRNISQYLVNIVPSIKNDVLVRYLGGEINWNHLNEYFNDDFDLTKDKDFSLPYLERDPDKACYLRLCMKMIDLFSQPLKDLSQVCHVKSYSNEVMEITSVLNSMMSDEQIQNAIIDEYFDFSDSIQFDDLTDLKVYQSTLCFEHNKQRDIAGFCEPFVESMSQNCITSSIFTQYHPVNPWSGYHLKLDIMFKKYEGPHTESPILVFKDARGEKCTVPLVKQWVNATAETVERMMTDNTDPHRVVYPIHDNQLYDIEDLTFRLAMGTLLMKLDWIVNEQNNPVGFNTPYHAPSLLMVQHFRLLCFIVQGFRLGTSGDSEGDKLIESLYLMETHAQRFITQEQNKIEEMRGEWPMGLATIRLNVLENLMDSFSMPKIAQRFETSGFTMLTIGTAKGIRDLSHVLGRSQNNAALLSSLLRSDLSFAKVVIILIKSNNHSHTFIQNFAVSIGPSILEQHLDEIDKVLSNTMDLGLQRIDKMFLCIEYLMLLLQFRERELLSDGNSKTVLDLLSFQNPVLRNIFLSIATIRSRLDVQILENMRKKRNLMQALNEEIIRHQTRLIQHQSKLDNAKGARLDNVHLDIELTQGTLQDLLQKVEKDQLRYPYLSGFVRLYDVLFAPRLKDDIIQLLNNVLKCMIGVKVTIGNSNRDIHQLCSHLSHTNQQQKELTSPFDLHSKPILNGEGIQNVVESIYTPHNVDDLIGKMFERHPSIELKNQFGPVQLFGNVLFQDRKPFHIFYIKLAHDNTGQVKQGSIIGLQSVLTLLHHDAMGVQTLFAIDRSEDETGADVLMDSLDDNSLFYLNLEEIITLRLSSFQKGQNEVTIENWFHEDEEILDGAIQKYPSKTKMISSIQGLIQETSGVVVDTIHDDTENVEEDSSWHFDEFDLNCFTVGLRWEFVNGKEDINYEDWNAYLQVLKALSFYSLSTERFTLRQSLVPQKSMDKKKTSFHRPMLVAMLEHKGSELSTKEIQDICSDVGLDSRWIKPSEHIASGADNFWSCSICEWNPSKHIFTKIRKGQYLVNGHSNPMLTKFIRQGYEILESELHWNLDVRGESVLQHDIHFPTDAYDVRLAKGTLKSALEEFLFWGLHLDGLSWRWVRLENESTFRGYFDKDAPVSERLIWSRSKVFTWKEVYFYKIVDKL